MLERSSPVPKAYVLIVAKKSADKDVLLEPLMKIEEVKEAYQVIWSFDVVAKIVVKDIRQLKHTIISKIRQLPQVEKTVTLIAAES
jgi:DNA-binding Lrp family transcriptional regulator